MWNVGGLGVNYGSAASGRLWSAGTNPAQVGPDWIGNTVYNTMAPILVFRNPADSGVRCGILSLGLYITNLPGDNVHLHVEADRIDRYVTLSGTLHNNGNADAVMTLQAAAGRPAVTSVLQIYDELVDYEATTFTNTLKRADTGANVTLTSLGLAQDIDYGVLPAGKGNGGSFAFNGGLVLEPGTTAAVYAWSAITAPQGRWSLRWTEEKLNVS